MSRCMTCILALVPSVTLTTIAQAVDLRAQSQTAQNPGYQSSPYYDGSYASQAQYLSTNSVPLNSITPAYQTPHYGPVYNNATQPVLYQQSVPFQPVMPNYVNYNSVPTNRFFGGQYPVNSSLQRPVYYAPIQQRPFPNYSMPVQNYNSPQYPVSPFRCDPLLGCSYR